MPAIGQIVDPQGIERLLGTGDRAFCVGGGPGDQKVRGQERTLAA